MSYESPHFDDWPEDAESLLPERQPFIDIDLDKETFSLDWENTLVRKFKVGNGQFDHFIIKIPDDSKYVFFDTIEIGDDLRDFFEEHDYPTLIKPLLDEYVIKWFARVQGAQLTDTIPESLSD